MKTLPNGITVFNATPHVLRFWKEEWDKPVEVETDEVISAKAVVKPFDWLSNDHNAFVEQRPEMFVSTNFVGTDEGVEILQRAFDDGADVVVGSIVAAQAYPGLVVSMMTAPGYERVSPAEKRMNPDKFTVF